MAGPPATQFNGPVNVAAGLLALVVERILAVTPTRAGLGGVPVTPMEWLG